MNGNRIELAPEDQARAALYRLLGSLLAAAPDAGQLAQLAGMEETRGVLAESWAGLRAAAAKAEAGRIAGEFHDLFIGLGRGELVPYASFYLTGFLMEQPLADLRGVLARLGIERCPDVREPEDHAAALCEVMGLLIEGDGLNCNKSRVFFEPFVGSWMERFFADLEQAESADFYRSVARLGQAFLGIEQQAYALFG